MTPARLEVQGRDGLARVGVVHTAKGTFTTPCFMPVGTRGTVRLLDAGDLDSLAPQVVLANTYHLMLRPGAEVVQALGGLHRFTGWDGHILTDSGGYQVFSLEPRLDDDGVMFRSTYDGSLHRLTPEGAVAVQERLESADIQMALDICSGLPAPEEDIRLAAKRTLAWAARAREVHRRADQCLFGIVQGGVSVDLRAEHAAETAVLDFDGYGIGGLSVGEPREQMLPALGAAVAMLPVDECRAISWGSETRYPCSIRWPWASTCSTVSCPPAWPATAPLSAGRAVISCEAPATPPTTRRWTPNAVAGCAPGSAAATSGTWSW